MYVRPPSRLTQNENMRDIPNNHIIVGEPRRCICGLYGNKSIVCSDVIVALDGLMEFIGDYGLQSPSLVKNVEMVNEVVRPLIQDCD